MLRTVVALLILFTAFILGAPAPASGETDGSLTFGSEWWHQTAPEAKFQEFGEVPQGLFLESFDLRTWKGRNMLEAYGAHGLQDNQGTSASWWHGARFRADVEYTQIPHEFSFIARSPYTQLGQGTLGLPDSLQRANEQSPSSYAARMTDLLKAAPGVGLGFRTDISKARLRGRPDRGWQLELTGVERQRQGRKPYGGAFGFNSAIEIYEPISQRMVDVDALASYQRTLKNGSVVSLRAQAGTSAFDNNVDAIVWDNPKRITDRTNASAYVAGDGSSKGRLDLYPDNRSVHGDVAAALTLPHRTAVSAMVGVRQNTQDDKWLPYTINTAILQPDSFPLPGNDTNGKATIITQDYRVSSHPARSVSGAVRYRQYQYNNKTPEHFFAGSVRLDQVWEPIPATAEPRSNRQRTYGVDVDWDPVSHATLGGTYEIIQRTRTHREVEKDEEKAWTVEARYRPMSTIEARGRFRHGDRDLDEFLDEDYQDTLGNFVEQPTLRRFDVANRVQQLGDASVSWSAGKGLDLTTTYTYLFNDYPDSPLGLRSERQQAVAVEAAYEPTVRFNMKGGYGWGQVETDQHSRESSSGTVVQSDSTNWRARLKDWNSYVFGEVEYWLRPEKISLSASYEFQRSPGTYTLTNFKGTARSLPGTRYRRQDATVELGYKVDAGTEIIGRYAWEQWDVTDFASESVPLFFPVVGANNAIFLGDSALDYRASILALLLKRSF